MEKHNGYYLLEPNKMVVLMPYESVEEITEFASKEGNIIHIFGLRPMNDISYSKYFIQYGHPDATVLIHMPPCISQYKNVITQYLGGNLKEGHARCGVVTDSGKVKFDDGDLGDSHLVIEYGESDDHLMILEASYHIGDEVDPSNGYMRQTVELETALNDLINA